MRPGSLRIRALFVGFALVAPALAACDSWFERDAPAVDRAIVELDGGDAHVAASLLADYLESGQCTDGFDPKPALEGKPAAGFDFGLALFRIGEGYGKRFGEAGSTGELAPPADDEEVKQHRAREIACAKKLVRTVEESDVATAALKLRAHYLDGNLSFLAGDYTEAVHAYDRALTLAPAVTDGGDAISRDAAFNRAIALRRQNDPKDGGAGDGSAPPDGGNDGGADGGSDGGNDGGDGGGDGGDAGNDGGDGGGAGNDGGNGDGGKNDRGDGGGGSDGGEAQNDAGSSSPPPQPPPSPSAATPMDERTLDELERAPIFQREVGRAMRQRTRDMEDK